MGLSACRGADGGVRTGVSARCRLILRRFSASRVDERRVGAARNRNGCGEGSERCSGCLLLYNRGCVIGLIRGPSVAKSLLILYLPCLFSRSDSISPGPDRKRKSIVNLPILRHSCRQVQVSWEKPPMRHVVGTRTVIPEGPENNPKLLLQPVLWTHNKRDKYAEGHLKRKQAHI